MKTTYNKKQVLEMVENENTKDFLHNYVLDRIKKEEFTLEELKTAFEENRYLQDAINEQADLLVSVYNYNRLEWLKENYGTYEEYIEEFGINSTNFDLIQTIGEAMCMENEKEIREEIEELSDELELDLDI